MFRDMTAGSVTLLLGILAALAILTFKTTPKQKADEERGTIVYREMTVPAQQADSIPELPLPSAARCDRTVVVAVIDTGIDYTHPELAPAMWRNPGETGSASSGDRSSNLQDDDSNGFVDDVVGYDFVNSKGLAYDFTGHGTHVAGIITSQFRGLDRVCLRIMSLRYFDNSLSAYANLFRTVSSIKYAIANGADIINYSGGGSQPDSSEMAAVKQASDAGILFIAAAGNDGRDNQFAAYYPGGYRFENVISVASVTHEKKLLPSSNYGTPVSLAAPGLNVMSTLPGNRHGAMSGTSQATAYVTAAAASLWIRYSGPRETRASAVRRVLMEGAERAPGVVQFGIAGIVDVDRSITLLFAKEPIRRTR